MPRPCNEWLVSVMVAKRLAFHWSGSNLSGPDMFCPPLGWAVAIFCPPLGWAIISGSSGSLIPEVPASSLFVWMVGVELVELVSMIVGDSFPSSMLTSASSRCSVILAGWELAVLLLGFLFPLFIGSVVSYGIDSK